ncbi:MAG TPA: aldehyde dehydrogenase family protein, partial [Candidatus Acidoferrales bacterium]|nr:aldehyde dehydrogenase family protein [Candidatus Acidoferrales bacterium]
PASSLRDRDLISIQEARVALERASEAQKKFAAFSQEQVDAVVEACAEAATAAAEQLARTAVEETGYGNVPDKIIKNQLASVDVPRAIRGMKTAGIIRQDRERGILEIAEPVGVVAAIIPSTNPTSTTIYKTIISLKARNAIVLSPHPSAMRCICEAVGILQRATLKMGAPEGLIICLAHPTMQGTQELMKSRQTGVILATGGLALVRAAYSSGRPAFGVGPGNVPAFIERTADARKAVADIFAGKTFDYGTICSSEQSIVAEEAIAVKALEECKQQGAYFLSPEEIANLGALVFRAGAVTPNPQIVGRAATVLAQMAGIKVPAATRVLIARLDGVGREFPLSGEKLSPILAFYSVANPAAGIELCTRLLHYGGLGHTAAIHSQSEAAVKQFGLAVPAYRVVVNSSAVHGSIGYSTNLFPAMTLGCGSPGGNITSDNIGPQHLMNVKRVAWESRGVEHRTIPAEHRMGGGIAGSVAAEHAAGAPAAAMPKAVAAAAAAPASTPATATSSSAAHANAPAGSPTPAALQPPDRKTIAQVVERVLAARGIMRGSAAKSEGASAPVSESDRFDPKPTPEPADAASSRKPGFDFPAPAPASGERRVAFTPPPQAPATSAATSASAPASSTTDAALPAAAYAAPAPAEAPAPAVKVVDFVSESDVRVALTRGEKIHLGPKTIVTPAARDLASAHEVFVLADAAGATIPHSARD